jgi:hypothetical protein
MANTNAKPVEYPWIKLGTLHGLKGMLLGALTAVTLLTLSHKLFPAMRDFDFDFGLRLQAFRNEHVKYRSSSMPPVAKVPADSYLFLDVDPEPEVAAADRPMASSGCEALEARFPTKYPGALNCSGGRPLNRFLLAELIAGLRDRGPRLIVLDVDLSKQEGVIPSEENQALLEALKGSAASGPPILLPMAIEAAWQTESANYVQIAASERTLTGEPTLAANHVFTAIALAAPGEPVRRYPECYGTDRGVSILLPSLPFLAQELLVNPKAKAGHVCRPGLNLAAPRIVYTLPSLGAHQDSAREGAALDDQSREQLDRWSVYRLVYNRCLAAYFWDSTSLCGRELAYKGRIVVIGASNRVRRDRHSTPLGNMSGAEIVINATRSFVHHPQRRDPGFFEAVADELKVVALSSLIWAVYFFYRSFVHRKGDAGALPFLGRFKRAVALVAVFLAALAANLIMVVTHAAPSFSVLMAVMGVALEQYIDGVEKCLHVFDAFVRKALRISEDAGR